jgi:enterochelin esterase-like enzyme
LIDPETSADAIATVRDLFRRHVGIDVDDRRASEAIYCEEFARGGMSSGHVHVPTWRDRLLPVLEARIRECRWGLDYFAMPVYPYARQPIDFSEPVRYQHGWDSFSHPDVPAGTIIEHEWADSVIFPRTHRRFWVYVPAGYDEREPAALMVFQDGGLYLDPGGEVRAGVVFDNLMNRGDMPVTIGVFVDPGEPGNRNLEYDAFSDAYVNFLLTEIVPVVQQRYRITDDPDRWAICGGSSGGSCAFTAAWMRPDRFRRVLSFLGSFAQIEGGNRYLELIPATPRKPLRVYLQAGTRDIDWDQPEFNWFSSNLRVAAALAEKGYDLRFVLGDSGHSTSPISIGNSSSRDAAPHRSIRPAESSS